jgi:hypothetical protein
VGARAEGVAGARAEGGVGKGWKEERGPIVEQWKPISDKVEAHYQGRKKGKFQIQEGIRRRIWLVLKLL